MQEFFDGEGSGENQRSGDEIVAVEGNGGEIARAKAAEVVRLDAEGLQRTEIARRAGIGIASVYRVLADAKRVAGDRKVAA